MLRWAREHECPCNEGTCERPEGVGTWALLRWAREHGCPWNEVEVCLAGATRDRHTEVARWVREQ